MNYPQTFAEDMEYLAALYGWNDADGKEISETTQDNEQMVKYWTILAAAHRAGYKQHAGNGYIRLEHWCLARGFGDPFGKVADVAALEMLRQSDQAKPLGSK